MQTLKEYFQEKRHIFEKLGWIIKEFDEKEREEPYVVGNRLDDGDWFVFRVRKWGFDEFIDKWQRRKVIGQLVGHPSSKYVFLQIAPDTDLKVHPDFWSWKDSRFLGADEEEFHIYFYFLKKIRESEVDKFLKISKDDKPEYVY